MKLYRTIDVECQPTCQNNKKQNLVLMMMTWLFRDRGSCLLCYYLPWTIARLFMWVPNVSRIFPIYSSAMLCALRRTKSDQKYFLAWDTLSDGERILPLTPLPNTKAWTRLNAFLIDHNACVSPPSSIGL